MSAIRIPKSQDFSHRQFWLYILENIFIVSPKEWPVNLVLLKAKRYGYPQMYTKSTDATFIVEGCLVSLLSCNSMMGFHGSVFNLVFP